MRALPTTPPARMSFPMALAYARRGYAIRPVSWDGSEGGHELAWLIYPAGAPLARYLSAEHPQPGRPWKAGDLTRADWFAWWTCLSVECFVADETTGETPACLCEGGEEAFQWSFVAFEDDETAFDGVENPNQYLGLKSCSTACDCETPASGGTGTGTPGTGTGGAGSGSGSTGSGSGASRNPRPGNPGSAASGGSGSPVPASGSSSGPAVGGGGGGGEGGNRKRRRRDDGGKVGPTITLTPVLTDPEACQLGADPIPHTWSIGVELSEGPGIADLIYSVQVRVLGEIVGSWMLAPGGTATAEYTVTIAPDSANRVAIGTGAAFGGGPGCVPDEVDLVPVGVCGSTSSTPPTSSSSTPPPSSSSSTTPPSSSSTPPPTSSSSTLTPIVLNYDMASHPTACMAGGSVTYYVTGGGMAVGRFLYDDAGGTIQSPTGYYSNGSNWWQVTSGEIVNAGSC